jgi:anti-sigma factor ChrR (cupin superfamily)
MPTNNAASTSRLSRWVGGRELLRMAATALVFAMIVGYATYIGLRLRVTYTLNARVERLMAEQSALMQQNDQFHDQISARLDELERLMFGEVLAKIDTSAPGTPRTTASVQLWQKNRDAELRKRLAALEQWRAKVDEQRRN